MFHSSAAHSQDREHTWTTAPAPEDHAYHPDQSSADAGGGHPTLPGGAPGPPERRRFPGMASQIKHARRFVERVLSDSPQCQTATLLISELATNAITHSDSGAAGGKFEVTVYQAPNWSRVEVRDLGSLDQPRAQHHDPYDVSENGRGLDLVEALAATWGVQKRHDGMGRLVWFELVWEDEAALPGEL
ncbi:anti-sigma regulatory factor (Ser/Thr protein kinase) [Haloactinospora alba]|uniref:Anti-sigma regulatory factor (Ser/Thr protein kinase) n=1 Tax=Haloactinospora alba TaxID=405555 RepID=A0A543NGC4_9ACTN|nr:ATP-binding protein [Haloactinospora alba]TQN30899.1 anti-sigma regulatory factor (Ser/Thr protein kinase) [Haloactinospora alba]